MDRDRASIELTALLHDLVLETARQLTGDDTIVSLSQLRNNNEELVQEDFSGSVRLSGLAGSEEGDEELHEEVEEPQLVLTHPRAPGARVLLYFDDTMSVVDSEGNATPRARYDIVEFTNRGWVPADDFESNL